MWSVSRQVPEKRTTCHIMPNMVLHDFDMSTFIRLHVVNSITRQQHVTFIFDPTKINKYIYIYINFIIIIIYIYYFYYLPNVCSSLPHELIACCWLAPLIRSNDNKHLLCASIRQFIGLFGLVGHRAIGPFGAECIPELELPSKQCRKKDGAKMRFSWVGLAT